MAKKSSSRKSKKSNNTNYLIIAATAILCFVIFRLVSRQELEEGSFSEGPGASGAAEEAPQTEILEKSEMTRMKSQVQDRKRMMLAAQEKLGMQSMPIPRRSNGKFELPVVVAVKPVWCRVGEYESVKSWVRDFDKKIFLVSLESITSSGTIAKPVRVNLAELSKGFRYTFRLKMSEKTNENVTLSICTDREKKGRCSAHKPADYPRLDAIQSKNPNQPIKEDFTFLYHNLFIKDGEIWSYGAMDYSKDYKQKITSMLKKGGFAMGSFDESWKRAETIRSGKVGMTDGKLSVSFTRNDPNCDMR